jgi:lysophospholipase L1-like esterase
MLLARLTWPTAAIILLMGCAQTPTSPSSVPAGLAVGVVSSTSIPVPPRLTLTPPRALGVTRFVAYGDSITWGALSNWQAQFLFAAANGGYVERVEVGLNTHHAPQRFIVFNEGLPGELAVNALSRFRSVLTTRRPEAVLLLEGINDLNNDVSVSRVVGGLRQMLDAAATAGVPVLLATMYQTYAVTDPTGGFRPNGAAAVPALNAEIRRLVAGRLNVHLVDLERVMTERRFVGADGLHTTEAGFEIMASTFIATIEAAFPVRGSFQ